MADKVYIPNLVINEISDSLIDHVADQVGDKLKVDTTNLAKLDAENTFTEENHFSQISANSIVSANNLNVASTVGVDINVRYGSNDYRQITMTDTDGIQISSNDDTHMAQVAASPSGAGLSFNDRAIGMDNNHILISHTPTIITPTEWATMADNEVPTKKQILDNVQGGGSGGDSIPLTISNQMATYDATTLNSVKYDFGNNTYSIFGTNETSFTTKIRTSGNLEKTADVIIGTAGAYAIPDDLLHHFGLSMKEMGQIPIGFSVTSNGNNIGGLGIGGTTEALVLWGGKTTAGTGANCLSIQPSGISLTGQSARGNADMTIAGGGIVFNSPTSFNFNLGDSGTLTMSSKMISELKRLLGIS